MKIKSIKSIVLPIMIISIIFISNFTAFAVGTRLVDNDTIDQSCYNERSGFNSYMSYGYLYNGDARIENSSNSSKFYQWLYPASGPSGNTMTVSLSVYLKHSRFTDPRAWYSVQYTQFSSYSLGRINQRLATSGWNYLRNISVPSLYAGGGFISHYVELSPSGTPGGETGADAIQIDYIN